MKERRRYEKPTVTRLDVHPDESVILNCKEVDFCEPGVDLRFGS